MEEEKGKSSLRPGLVGEDDPNMIQTDPPVTVPHHVGSVFR